MIRIQCPVCNATMSAPDSEAGRKGACPQCGQRLQIPLGRPSMPNLHHVPVSGTVPQPRPVGTESCPVPSSRFRSFVCGAICGLLVGLAIGTAATLGITGARGPKPEAKRVGGPAADQPGAKAKPAREDARPFKTAGMTRHQFRQKLMKCQGASGICWDGINRRSGQYAFALLRKDFELTFGKAERTQTIDQTVYWYYRCSDGEIQLVLQYRPPSQEKMLFGHVDGRDRAYTSEDLLFLHAANEP